MIDVVLDASALLALLRREPGGDIVRASLSRAAISAVNYSEVLKKTLERGGSTEAAADFVLGLTIDIIPFNEARAASAAALYPKVKTYGLSFADRACLALGVERQAKVLTTDKKWKLVQLPITVTLIRHSH